MSSIATPGLRRPKNSGLHAALSASCSPHRPRASLRLGVGAAFHVRHADTVITAYRLVHTTGNTTLGGVNSGLSRVRYQPRTDDCVAALPAIADAAVIVPSTPNAAADRRRLGRATVDSMLPSNETFTAPPRSARRGA